MAGGPKRSSDGNGRRKGRQNRREEAASSAGQEGDLEDEETDEEGQDELQGDDAPAIVLALCLKGCKVVGIAALDELKSALTVDEIDSKLRDWGGPCVCFEGIMLGVRVKSRFSRLISYHVYGFIDS